MGFFGSIRKALRPLARIVRPLVYIFGLGTDAKKIAEALDVLDNSLPMPKEEDSEMRQKSP